MLTRAYTLDTSGCAKRSPLPLFQVPGGGPPGAPGQPGGGPPPPPFKLNIVESIERIKEEFNFLQAQYHK